MTSEQATGIMAYFQRCHTDHRPVFSLLSYKNHATVRRLHYNRKTVKSWGSESFSPLNDALIKSLRGLIIKDDIT